jgi:hypothetical protein
MSFARANDLENRARYFSLKKSLKTGVEKIKKAPTAPYLKGTNANKLAY